MTLASGLGDGAASPPLPIFDGHNDVLLRLAFGLGGEVDSFFQWGNEGHLDLPRAEAGGLRGGLFAHWAPPDRSATQGDGPPLGALTGHGAPLPEALEHGYALRTTMTMMACLFRLEQRSGGRLKVVRSAAELDECLAGGVFAAVAHFEGAEAIDPQLNALEVFYRAGLRSLGLVWSRPTAFAHGVPFAFPHSPDTGPGLTNAGRALVRACNRLRIMIDLSHLNEQGFWDVAALTDAPLVASHSNAHALTPTTRNLTDRQLGAIRESGGLVGVNFATAFLREDGRDNPDTPLETVVRHVDYLVGRLGIDGVALGSDFNGATIPRELGDAAGLPRLLEALRGAGYDDDALRRIGYANWVRVLRQTWGA